MKRQILLTSMAVALSAPLAFAQSGSTGTMAPKPNAPAMSQSSSGTSGMTSGTMSSSTAMSSDNKMMKAPTEKSFVNRAAQSNMFEIQSSKLALDKSQSSDVKKFAQHMVDDHSKAGDGLKQAVKQANDKVEVPAKLDNAHQKMLTRLQGLSGKKFDQAYWRMQRNGHDKTIALFQSYGDGGKDGPVRTFAQKTLPTLKQHREMISTMMHSS